jgi:predicted DNA-binding protein (UPF0251 family)
MMTKIDEVVIPRDMDSRYNLKDEDKVLVLKDLETMTRTLVAAKWGISKTTIFWMLNPEKYKAHLARKSGKKYYDTAKATEYKRKNRAKKKKIREMTTP